MCTFGLSGCRVKPRRPERKTENCGERERKSEILGGLAQGGLEEERVLGRRRGSKAETSRGTSGQRKESLDVFRSSNVQVFWVFWVFLGVFMWFRSWSWGLILGSAGQKRPKCNSCFDSYTFSEKCSEQQKNVVWTKMRCNKAQSSKGRTKMGQNATWCSGV